MTVKWLVLVGIAAAISVAPGDAEAKKKKRTLCPGGRFVVHERPLIVANPALVVDDIMIMPQARMLSVSSGCPLTRVRMKATKKGTRVRGKWANCTGLVGRVRLKAVINRTCETMTGRIRAKRAKYKRHFIATLSRCGDNIYDSPGGEQCDAGQGCVAPLVCRTDCTCGTGGPGGNPGGSTTTTTISGGGSTTTTTLTAADLTVSVGVTPGLRGEAGQPVRLNWTVTNIGNAIARGIGPRGDWHDVVYLSADDELDGGDAKLLPEFRRSLPLNPGEDYGTIADLELPLVAPGFYYIIVKTDDRNVVVESNELNNEDAAIIEVTVADLEPTKFDPQPLDGGKLEMIWQVQNNGDATAYGPRHDALYLSSDPVLDDDDTLLKGFDVVQPLGPRAHTLDQSVIVNQPAPGSYLILVIDEDDTVFEFNENNNVRVRQIHDGR